MSNKNVLIGAVAVTIAGIATGGTAYIFAPEIAVAIVGNAFVGLKGAALTNASLAMLGGGSLAAGGLGMAGGTTFIVGGGSLLSSSLATVSAMSLIASKSSHIVLSEASKILTFTREELINVENNQLIISDIYKALLRHIAILNIELDEKISSGEKSNKKEIKNMKLGIKYLENTSKLVLDLLNVDNEENNYYSILHNNYKRI